MVGSGDRSTNTVRSANRPVLLKGRSALDGRLIGASCLVDVVGSAVARDAAFLCRTRAGSGVVVAVGVDDVVFDEGAGGPAVDGEVGV